MDNRSNADRETDEQTDRRMDGQTETSLAAVKTDNQNNGNLRWLIPAMWKKFRDSYLKISR